MELYLLMSVPLALVGLVILGIASMLHRSALDRRRRATVRADARIVEKRVQRGSAGHRHHPRFVYEFPVNGIMRRAEYAGKWHMREGDIISVFYDPNRPESIYIPEVQSWAAVIALYFIGGTWVFLGILLAIFWKLGIQ